MRWGLRTAACFGVIGMLAGLAPAHATGNFLCEADDASLELAAESTFSHGLGEAFMGFGAKATIKVEGTPKDLTELAFASAHLVHHWFTSGALNLHLYREREGSAAHGYVELIIETRQSPDDETAFAGTYEITVYDVGVSPGGEGRTWTAKGKVACSVG
ncbi:MAG: hypothetical protein AB7S70_10270 [Hyphomicrobium sp.]|uniref:hypothetical protein n=1 Tax=Hyphomicrobium sp. TaxID=82 RepID=UPI003D0A0E0E